MAKKSKHDIWLTDGEDLLCAAEEGGSKQAKILLLTNKRLILIQALETKELTDIDDKMWKEFRSVSLRQGFWNSTLTINFSTVTASGLWEFHKIKKSIAVQAYRLMKNKEVAMREAAKSPSPPAKAVAPPPPVVASKVPVVAPKPAVKSDPPPVVAKDSAASPEKTAVVPAEDKKIEPPAKKIEALPAPVQEVKKERLFERIRKKLS